MKGEGIREGGRGERDEFLTVGGHTRYLYLAICSSSERDRVLQKKKS